MVTNRIREEREKQNMTQSELAEKANLSRQIISTLENDNIYDTKASTMYSIAEALGKKVEEIFFIN